MSTLEKYILLCKIIGKSTNNYKHINQDTFTVLKQGYDYKHIPKNLLTKSNLILANIVWEDVKELYRIRNMFDTIYLDLDSRKETIEYIKLLLKK